MLITTEPFKTKQLSNGTKLFRRKHGKKALILANSETEVIFTVPYTQVKINELEIVGGNSLDRVDILIKSPIDQETASIHNKEPNIVLNQYGFDINISENFYIDKSEYDADVSKGFQIIIIYKNDTSSDVTVGFNLIYHEVVSG